VAINIRQALSEGLAVDPIGVVQSISYSAGISFNFFCEFVKPLLDFDLPEYYCGGK
jgi:hypothetical protein